MTELYEVKRVEAQGLLTELKSFAFEQSPSLRSNDDLGFEITKSFYHDDPVPRDLISEIGREMCQSTFSFETFRTPPVKNKRSFAYTLGAQVERSLPNLSPMHLTMLDQDMLEFFSDMPFEDGDLSEITAVRLSISDHEMRDIDVDQSYTITYQEDEICHRSTEDVLYSYTGTTAAIDPEESDDYIDKLFIAEPINHESLSPAENVIINTGFWDIVEPFSHNLDQGVSYGSAAQQIRAILRALRTGEVV